MIDRDIVSKYRLAEQWIKGNWAGFEFEYSGKSWVVVQEDPDDNVKWQAVCMIEGRPGAIDTFSKPRLMQQLCFDLLTLVRIHAERNSNT